MSSRFIMPFADVGSGIKPSSGAKLFFFELDGVTQKNTFSDQLASPTANTNPVISDSNGVFGNIYINGSYKVTLQNKNGTQAFGGVIVEELGVGDLSLVHFFPTLNLAINSSIDLPIGKKITIGDRNNSAWTVGLTSGITPNPWNTVASVSVPTKCFILDETRYPAFSGIASIVDAVAWGYVADAVTPNQDVVLQFIIDAYTTSDNDSGVEIHLGGGSAILSAEILISSPNITLVGTGKRNVYLENDISVPGPAVASKNSPTTLFAVHTDRNLIRIYRPLPIPNLNFASTLTFKGVNFATLEVGDMPTACFGFDASGQFQRDYTIRSCGVFGFRVAFDMYDETGIGNIRQFGGMVVSGCNINRNGQVFRNKDTTQWNGLVFKDNESGQNGFGLSGEPIFDLRGQSISIIDNILEGQLNCIKISGNYRGAIIKGNYFEINGGDFVIYLRELLGLELGVNYFQNSAATDLVLLFSCTNPIINEIINVNMDGCINPQVALKQFGLPSGNTSVSGASVLIPFEKAAHHDKRTGGKSLLFGTIVTVEKLFNNIENSGGALFTSAGTGIQTRTAAAVTYAEDDLICAVSIVSYDSEPVLAPRLNLTINSNADGGSSGIFNNHAKANLQYKNNTFVMMSYARADKAGTANISANLYPYGLNPAGGLTATFTTFIWNMGQASERDGLTPFVCPEQWDRASAAPLVGTWNIGDTLKLTKGAGWTSGGTSGFYCAVAGTPGTWRTMGVLTP